MTNAYRNNEKYYEYLCTIRNSRCAYYNFFSVWDARGIIFIDYLEKGQTINSEYNMALLERLNDEIKKKGPDLKKKSAVSSRQCTVSQINQNDGKIV
jgi:hypothetical protein